MEQDREATNLGPETPEEISAAAQTTALRQPRKRFVGRRKAEEHDGTIAQCTQLGTTNPRDSSSTLQTRKPTRGPRVLNQVPASILDDPDINAAVAHLPGNYNFEIHKTIHRVRTAEARNVALQFPEGLLMFAPLISDILTQFCPGTETLIMGDVTYGACCIDDYTARALGCDLLVHYGHSCLVPVDTTKGIKVLYVFVTIGIDTEHLLATIERNFQTRKRLALVGTIQFNATLHSILPRLHSLGYDAFLPRSAPLSAGEILGCTAPSLVSKKTRASATAVAQDDPLSADLVLYVGDGRFHLESILIASPSLRNHTYRYDPYTRRLTHETYAHEEMHSLRQSAISTARRTLARASPSSSFASSAKIKAGGDAGQTIGVAEEVAAAAASYADQHHQKDHPVETTRREPRTWAIILGTLGRQGNPHTLSLITTHLEARGIPVITLLLSEIQPQKLALMSADVGVWVQIACPRLSIDWGYAFERPLLSPYEALVALDIRDATGWQKGGSASESEKPGMEGAAGHAAMAGAKDSRRETGVAGTSDGGEGGEGAHTKRESQRPETEIQTASTTNASEEKEGKEGKGEKEEENRGRQEEDDDDDERVGIYPMDFYAKDGLGRTKAEQVPAPTNLFSRTATAASAFEVEVR